MIAAFFQLSPASAPLLWLLSPIPFTGALYASASTLLLALFAQLAILGMLAQQLQQQILRAGESQSKKQQVEPQLFSF